MKNSTPEYEILEIITMKVRLMSHVPLLFLRWSGIQAVVLNIYIFFLNNIFSIFGTIQYLT